MSTSPNTFTGEDSDVKSNDYSAQGKKPKNSDALGRKSLPQPPCNGDEVETSSDQSPSSVIVQNLHTTSSEPVFSSCESPLERTRPRAKSVPTMVEQQVALFLRSVSDDINNSYGNSSRNATGRNRRASVPGNFRLQQTLSPLLRALPMGLPSPTNLQRPSASGSQGGTTIVSRRTGVRALFSSSSMDNVPEEESDSGDEV